MKLTFLTASEKVLTEEQKPLTAKEIWQAILTRGYEQSLQTQGKTPWKTIESQIHVNMVNHQNTIFTKVGSGPVRFALKTFAEPALHYQEPDEPVLVTPKFNFIERELHLFLAYYAFTHLKTITETVYHEKSTKKSGSGEWLHPDMVGVVYPEWRDEVKDLSKAIGTRSLRLVSFELKRELNRLNLRESFFQAVSNSSWANEGYLVAAVIENDDEFQSDLKRLSNAFGIGILRLNPKDPDNSEMLFPARMKQEIDWETVNVMCSKNPDFRDFVVRVQKDFLGNEVHTAKYDPILTIEELTEKSEKWNI
ncbi:HTH domain-containing protein [Paenibacillus glycanilyticus]|uniref:HTH domain-containing protein n=1 Tax=Paenibacillus glycanilyticus TaxID=126569 RepID=UPI00203D90C8|nr:HTH domain-containing protein [Paenibacillus glycanilyticus]MCM3631147.1 HTH domain-containing protein [Paenibacillus glycanilyticus]